jgi:hypothetical protein
VLANVKGLCERRLRVLRLPCGSGVSVRQVGWRRRRGCNSAVPISKGSEGLELNWYLSESVRLALVALEGVGARTPGGYFVSGISPALL